MLAGAGGGACSYYNGARGGDNLGLEGEDGLTVIYNDIYEEGKPSTGATQEGPGQGYFRPSNYGFDGSPGALGKGGGYSYLLQTGAGAGGSGLYGGGSGGYSDGVVSSGAAGSSFVNGCSGCASLENLTILSDVAILGGNATMPSPLGVNETGHYGNGFARITVQLGGFDYPASCERRGRREMSSFVHLAAFLLLGC